jgi:16S rRNA (cytidine1402-2'-O)-methyltransferase
MNQPLNFSLMASVSKLADELELQQFPQAALYVIATPIGNVSDISLRALKVLSMVEEIACEDTRKTSQLLTRYGISKKCFAAHQHNERSVAEKIVQQLRDGARIALVSDAGTPGISDPGFLLVRACVRAGVEVTCLPGATAIIPALAASGLPTDSFHYEGFLPHKKGRQTRLKYIEQLSETSVIYESPHRLVKLIDELSAICGPDRNACVCRELSKLHETFHRGSLFELQTYFKEHPGQVRGEIVFLLAGKS